MNLYKISQDQNNEYDTYDSAIVAAHTEFNAKRIYPGRHWNFSEGFWEPGEFWSDEKEKWLDKYGEEKTVWDWTDNIEYVKVELIGTAHESIKKEGVILASYNAG